MLKGIPSILSPDLLKILMEMGHGDEIVIADGNFPAASCAKRLVRCDGHDVPSLLHAILQLMPLDAYVDAPAVIMQLAGNDTEEPPIWKTFAQMLTQYEPQNHTIASTGRQAFYDRAKQAYAIVATGETALYANIILKKGVVVE